MARHTIIHAAEPHDPSGQREFVMRNLDDAITQAEADLERGLRVFGIKDDDGKMVRKVRDGKLVSR